MGKTLFDKLWSSHVVKTIGDADVLYIDRHYIHEVTSPQAFSGIEKRELKVFRPEQTIATADHNVPTKDLHLGIKDELSRIQLEKLSENCTAHGIKLFDLKSKEQGIVHVMGPELGFTLPGFTIVCGDSHTSTHGAFACIAFGIGTSEVEQVLASQCIVQERPKIMRITINGKIQRGVTAKDVTLYVIQQLTTSGGNGYFLEFAGETVSGFSMEERMTLCNMSIELGARGGLVAMDDTTLNYLSNIPSMDTSFIEYLKQNKNQYVSDADAIFHKEIVLNVNSLKPLITYGTNPAMSIAVDEVIPEQESIEDVSAKEMFNQSINYMGHQTGICVAMTKISHVFIGSCTNGRIEDLRSAASIIKGRKKAEHVQAWVVPGSKLVKQQAIEEGLDKLFMEAGFEFRDPGCSACLAMNEDKIPAGAYCVSTSNRNFEGRQGSGARTMLASPLTAAASALKGYVADVREYLN
jgi:3-isopropylmalate/(R)-2-methylmalate dehydratase large subunit